MMGDFSINLLSKDNYTLKCNNKRLLQIKTVHIEELYIVESLNTKCHTESGYYTYRIFFHS